MTHHVAIGIWMAVTVLAPAAAGADVRIEQNVSQTAVFPGDRFQYQVTVTVPADGQIAVEDFDRKNVNFGVLAVEHTAREITTLPTQGTRYRFEYFLASYETGTKSIDLPRIVFRYQPPAEARSTRPTTQEAAVPVLPIAVRSTLNQPLKDSWIEESLSAQYGARRHWIFMVAGVLGLLVSSFPLWVWLRSLYLAWRVRRERPSWREFLDRWVVALDHVESAGAVDVKTRFKMLEHLAGEYVGHVCDLAVDALTPEQLRAKMDERQVSPAVRDVLQSTFSDAQNCRYSPAGDAAWEERFRQDLIDLRTLAA